MVRSPRPLSMPDDEQDEEEKTALLIIHTGGCCFSPRVNAEGYRKAKQGFEEGEKFELESPNCTLHVDGSQILGLELRPDGGGSAHREESENPPGYG